MARLFISDGDAQTISNALHNTAQFCDEQASKADSATLQKVFSDSAASYRSLAERLSNADDGFTYDPCQHIIGTCEHCS